MTDDELYKALEKLEDEDGELHVSRVIEEARNPSSPLHGLFEWDDEQAAKAYRYKAARDIVNRAILLTR